MSVYYENTYTVDSRDVDPWGQCRPSSLLGILQEAATAAAVRLGVSRDEVIKRYHAFWMLARIWYRLDRPLRWNEALTVRTWHRGGKGASMYRDFDLTVDGARVGEAVSTWVLADVESHRLLRLSKIYEFEGTTGGALCKDVTLSRVRLPESLTPAGRRELYYSDCDINGHVNNVKYADFACDALHMERLGEGKFLSSLQVGYLRECRAGEGLNLSAGGSGGALYVHGLGDGGEVRFDAALTLGEL